VQRTLLLTSAKRNFHQRRPGGDRELRTARFCRLLRANSRRYKRNAARAGCPWAACQSDEGQRREIRLVASNAATCRPSAGSKIAAFSPMPQSPSLWMESSSQGVKLMLGPPPAPTIPDLEQPAVWHSRLCGGGQKEQLLPPTGIPLEWKFNRMTQKNQLLAKRYGVTQANSIT